jgi:L-alanine-DL-glutamate epimerase-like enolase superfamily enzyme
MSRVEQVAVGYLAYQPEIQWQRPERDQIATIVRVRATGGIEGVSVTWNDSPSPEAMALTIDAWFGEGLVGRDVRTHPAGFERELKRAAWNGTSPVAVAAIDNALWDAKAKVAGLPVHAALGTRHESLPVYAGSRAELQMKSAEEVADHVIEARESGHGVYKLHLWGDWRADIANCELVRRRLGDGYGLMFDPMERYSLGEAVTVAGVLERLGFLWFEDPISCEQRQAYSWLADRVSIPLVAADALQWSFNDYAEAARARAPMLLRLDAGRQGLTFCRRVMELANDCGVGCEIHAFGPEANSVAGLHLALAQRPVSYYEACFPRRDFEIPGIEVPTRLDRAGRVAAPTRPGLGLEIDWADIERRIEWVGGRR